MADIANFDAVAGAARTAAQLLGLIEKIDLAIYNLINTGKDAGINYTVGDRSVDRDGYLQWLLSARKTYVLQLASLPAWEATVYDDPDV
jgi:hypothetical protein